jgi:hypothetical protein
MSEQQKEKEKPQLQIVVESELDRLKRDIYRSDKEKYLLLMQRFRRNAMFKKAVITYK